MYELLINSRAENRESVSLLLASPRSFSGEQLYHLKGTHAGIVKLKFNRLLNVAKQYEKEIVKFTGGSQDIENIYDGLMEILIEVKRQVNEQE